MSAKECGKFREGLMGGLRGSADRSWGVPRATQAPEERRVEAGVGPFRQQQQQQQQPRELRWHPEEEELHCVEEEEALAPVQPPEGCMQRSAHAREQACEQDHVSKVDDEQEGYR